MKYLLYSFLLWTSPIFGQIKTNETDKFTKQRRVETETKTLKSSMGSGLSCYIRSVDSTAFFILKGYGSSATVIGANDKLIFLLDDETTIECVSTGVQTYKLGSSKATNTFNHQYGINKNGLSALANHSVKSIRRYGADGYSDFEIPKRNQADIKEISTAIFNLLYP